MIWWKLQFHTMWALSVFVIHRLFQSSPIQGNNMARHWQEKSSRFFDFIVEYPDLSGTTLIVSPFRLQRYKKLFYYQLIIVSFFFNGRFFLPNWAFWKGRSLFCRFCLWVFLPYLFLSEVHDADGECRNNQHIYPDGMWGEQEVGWHYYFDDSHVKLVGRLQ